jgi:hypothetical protein
MRLLKFVLPLVASALACASGSGSPTCLTDK